MRKKRDEAELRSQIKYWKRLEKLLGWKLFGWTYRLSASFLTIGNYGQKVILNIDGAAADALVKKMRRRRVLAERRRTR